jgi:hypothetical protein
MRATEGLIAVLVGAILVFAVIIPLVQNATMGSQYLNDGLTNTTQHATVQVFNATDCQAAGYSVASVQQLYNATGDLQSTVSVSGGTIRWTNSTPQVTTTVNATANYRCYDGAYITNTTARNIADILQPLVVVLILVAIAAMIYMRRE